MAENEQFPTPILCIAYAPLDASPAPLLPSPARLSTLRCFSRLDDRRGRAPTENRACVVPRGSHGACVHTRTHAWYARNETRNNPARSMRPFCRTALSPRRGGTDTRGRQGDTEGYEGMAHTARLGNRRKRIVTCLSADVHRRVCVRELRA